MGELNYDADLGGLKNTKVSVMACLKVAVIKLILSLYFSG
jgi:hypothetical protein